MSDYKEYLNSLSQVTNSTEYDTRNNNSYTKSYDSVDNNIPKKNIKIKKENSCKSYESVGDNSSKSKTSKDLARGFAKKQILNKTNISHDSSVSQHNPLKINDSKSNTINYKIIDQSEISSHESKLSPVKLNKISTQKYKKNLQKILSEDENDDQSCYLDEFSVEIKNKNVTYPKKFLNKSVAYDSETSKKSNISNESNNISKLSDNSVIKKKSDNNICYVDSIDSKSNHHITNNNISSNKKSSGNLTQSSANVFIKNIRSEIKEKSNIKKFNFSNDAESSDSDSNLVIHEPHIIKKYCKAEVQSDQYFVSKSHDKLSTDNSICCDSNTNDNIDFSDSDSSICTISSETEDCFKSHISSLTSIPNNRQQKCIIKNNIEEQQILNSRQQNKNTCNTNSTIIPYSAQLGPNSINHSVGFGSLGGINVSDEITWVSPINGYISSLYISLRGHYELNCPLSVKVYINGAPISSLSLKFRDCTRLPCTQNIDASYKINASDLISLRIISQKLKKHIMLSGGLLIINK